MIRETSAILPADAWTFGTNQLLTTLGLLTTFGIAALGFRTFDKWKREKIEERRIDIALEALALAYEAGPVFESIRNPMSFEGEWSELMSINDPEKRRAAEPFFGTLKRLEYHRDYFERSRSIQPRFMAVFGKDAKDIFQNLYQARSHIEVSARRLMQSALKGELYGDTLRQQYRERLENDVWDADQERDRIGPKIRDFVAGVEKHCLPLVTHRYARMSK